MIERARKRLSKRAKKGFRGWPLATVALYGPDDSPLDRENGCDKGRAPGPGVDEGQASELKLPDAPPVFQLARDNPSCSQSMVKDRSIRKPPFVESFERAI
jgi:hypothetical protein